MIVVLIISQKYFFFNHDAAVAMCREEEEEEGGREYNPKESSLTTGVTVNLNILQGSPTVIIVIKLLFS